MMSTITPACRHAVGTISLSDLSDIRRMVSEDSDQFVSGLLAIHLLSDLSHRDQPVWGQMAACFNQLNASGEPLEVLLLRRAHWMQPEEWNYRFQQIVAPAHDESVQVLFVVVIPLVREDLTDPKEVTNLM